ANLEDDQGRCLVIDYILKTLDLENCADTIVGNEMRRGISGGQKKRLTIGEMLVGPARVFFMDEISTGLDSSTTFQIMENLHQLVHNMDVTMVISLLQPTPETFELFDEIILMSEGQIAYQGPREKILDFFEFMGFRCPNRKSTADFLQEVMSKMDQEQYWANSTCPYKYVPVSTFAEAFQSFHVGELLTEELQSPYDFSKSHPSALVSGKYGLRRWQLFVACFWREWLLMKRNSFVHIFKMFQICIMASIVTTVFLRTAMKQGSITDGNRYLGAIFCGVVVVMFNGMTELTMTVLRLPVFYKQRDLQLYPGWVFLLPIFVLQLPVSLAESGIWVALTYHAIGFAPSVSRFFRQFLVFFSIHQMSIGLFRFIAAVGRTQVVANTFGTALLIAIYVLGGFVISKGALAGFSLLFNVLCILALGYFQAPRKRQVSAPVQSNDNEESLSYGICVDHSATTLGAGERGMVLPFQPFSLTFTHINYYVDMPAEMKKYGVREKRLQLLKDVSGSFRPGVLTALMGVTGAGKTTLMDVLAGRKTGGYIEGNISISGYPKNQETFARISGYCEQINIHSPFVTVYESLLYSAWLRLPRHIETSTQKMFMEEVMCLMELKPLRNSLVGIPGLSGLSTEQRKRLTIAVELVANPSIIFMDEPTSGLDARAAAIVMRTVRNTVDTGRTVVCTIHQPGIDIFEAFDEVGRSYMGDPWVISLKS
ncbi:hypothetical protein AMTR_s00069p00193120, partial [Amborella trichopoda]